MSLTPLAYMRKFGAFEIRRENYTPFENVPGGLAETGTDYEVDERDRILDADRKPIGVQIDGQSKAGFATPSRKLEFYSPTLAAWGWPEKENVIPWPLKSHVHPDYIDREAGEMILLPTTDCRP